MAFPMWPYSSLHDLNLDWILSKVQKIDQTEQDLKTAVEAAEESATAAEDAKIAAVDAKDVAVQAKTDAVSAKNAAAVSATVAQAALTNIGTGTAGAVADWLAAHVDPDTGYVIDDTLTISLAAADARAVGVRTGGLREFWVEDPKTLTWEQGSINSVNGTNMTASNRVRTDFVEVPTNIPVYVEFTDDPLDPMKYFYNVYDDDQTFIESVGPLTDSTYIITEKHYYIRFVAGFVSDATISGDGPVTLTAYKYTDTDIGSSPLQGTEGKAADARAVCEALSTLAGNAQNTASFEAAWAALNRGDLYEAVVFDPLNTGAAAQSNYTVSGISYDTDYWAFGYRSPSDNTYYNNPAWMSNRPFGLQNLRDDEPVAVSIEFDPVDDAPDDYYWGVVYRFEGGERKSFDPIRDGSRSIFLNTRYGEYPATSALNIQLGHWTTSSMADAQAVADRLDYCNNHVHVKLYYYKKQRNYLGRPGTSNGFTFDSDLDYATKGVSSICNGPKPMLILCHGLSSTIDASMWGSSPNMMPMVRNFVNAGYFVLDVNQVTEYDWCNPGLYLKYIAAIDDACNKYNAYPAYIYGESMGSLVAMWLSKYYKVKACAISGCRLDLKAMYNSYVTGGNVQAVETIDENLGFSNGFDDDIAAMFSPTISTCPNSNGDEVNVQQFPPTLFMFGGSDTSYYGQATDKARIEELRRGGNLVITQDYPGVGHRDMCYLIATGTFDAVTNWFNLWK